MGERHAEAGFGLLEVVVCVGILMTASVFALALLPSLIRASQAQLMRGAATGIARNALERARAAAAYYPTGAAPADHAWVLQPAATYTAGVRVQRGLCGAAAATTDVALTVASTYDAPSDTLTVAVSYPPNPCDSTRQSTLSLAAQLAPAAYAPQTQVPVEIADPALQ
jgi:type II secretory pathway pseudopilin PulG